MAQESLGTVVKRRVQGVVFLIMVAALIGLSIAIYNKAFTTTVDVTLMAQNTGNQLQEASDVKENGLIVGSVGSVSSNGDVAKIQLKLDPGMVKEIPSNVYARILPKTLFGEQYVSLVVPTNPAGPIRNGDTIAQDRSRGALEAQTVLGNLYPLLTYVQPAQLNATLTALATALHNRGGKLGQTLVNLDNYLKILNGPSGVNGNTYTAQLVDDLDKLGRVALEYNGVSPDLFASLQNLLVSARTVIAKKAALDNLLTAGSGAAGILQSFLNDNEQRIITVSKQTSQIFNVLNIYSPEYGCLFSGISKLYDKASNAVYNGAIHLSATVVAPDPTFGAYKKGEEPKLIKGYGPNCFGLPNNISPVDGQGHFQIPAKYKCLNDGAALTKAGNSPTCSASSASTSAANTSALNSPAEDAMVNTIASGYLGTSPGKVPSSSTLLVAPLLRGQTVATK